MFHDPLVSCLCVPSNLADEDFFYSGNRWERRKTGIRSRNRSTLLAHGCKTYFNALELPGTYDPQPFSLFLKKKEES